MENGILMRRNGLIREQVLKDIFSIHSTRLKNTGLMKLGNFPFTLLENLRENSPGE